MKASHFRSAFFLTLLFACCGWLYGAGNEERLPTDPPASSDSVSIPGPLRSFLRMAAISQKVAPEEVLPFLARNVVVEGFTWQASRGRPSEYLLLLRQYVEQARELKALAGAEGVIRISSCSQASSLLATLGYRLEGACGRTASLEGADSKRAFLTLDSGFPLTDLEQSLQDGKPFAYPFPSTQVPVLFSPGDWTRIDRNRRGDVLDVFLHDPQAARLYWGLARIDANTRAVLRQSPGLEELRRSRLSSTISAVTFASVLERW